MKKLSVLCAVVGLLVAACGGGDSSEEGEAAPESSSQTTVAPQPTEGDLSDDEAHDPSASTEQPVDATPEEEEDGYDAILQPSCGGEGERSATAPGVSAEAIKVGAPQIDYEELGNLGLVQINRGSADVVYEALSEELNENGGICGRMLETVTFKFLPFGTATSLAGCVYFTEDEEVFAVLGEFSRVPAGNLCVTETHSTAIFGAPHTAEDLARANAPWVHLGIASDRKLEVFVAALGRAGLLADVGNVAVHSDVVFQDRVDNTLVPALEAAGVNIVERTVLDVPPADTQAAAAVWRTFQEIYRSSDIDSVFVEGDSSAVEQLIQGGLDVDLYSSDQAPFVFALRESSDPSYFDAYSIGTPFVEGQVEQRMVDCIEIFERRSGFEVVDSESLSEGEVDWDTTVNQVCAVLDLFVQVATAAGPNLTNETLQSAIDDFGSIKLPNQVFASLGPGKYDVQDGVGLVKFDHEAEGGEGGFVIVSDLINTAE